MLFVVSSGVINTVIEYVRQLIFANHHIGCGSVISRVVMYIQGNHTVVAGIMEHKLIGALLCDSITEVNHRFVITNSRIHYLIVNRFHCKIQFINSITLIFCSRRGLILIKATFVILLTMVVIGNTISCDSFIIHHCDIVIHGQIQYHNSTVITINILYSLSIKS